MDFSASYHTDIGIRKKTNQDSLAVRIIDSPIGKITFAIVCDGMGGLEKGELASKEVIFAFCDWFDNTFTKQVMEDSFTPASLRSDWNNIIQFQNRRLGSYGAVHNIMLGTTVSALLMMQDVYYVCHVGDSRIYELSDVTKQITEDQTFVHREVSLGRMTEEEAKVDPRRSVLLQCVGASQVVEPDFHRGQMKKNAVYLLCSDGFRHQVSDEEVMNYLGPKVATDDAKMKYGCEYLTDLVKSRRETDNITVAVIRTF